MDVSSYLIVIGETQGKIEGSCTHQNHVGEIELLSFSHDVTVPTMDELNQSQPQTSHSPVIIQKAIDVSTPRLHKALFHSERLSIEFEWYRYQDGEQELFYQVALEGALVSKISALAPHLLDESKENYQFSEQISFVYETITWSYGQSGEVLHSQNWLDRL